METILIIQIGAILVCFILYHLYRRNNVGPRLPPGPKGLPIVGNINDLPPPGQPEYLHWLKFKDTYGLLSSLTILGQPMIIIHDKTAANFLLEKSALKTSARPVQVFAEECGFGVFLPSRQYNADFRRHRKLIHQQLGTKTIASAFNDIQDVESRRLLFRILTDPGNIVDHFKTEASAIILKITYGYSVEPHTTDPLVGVIQQMMENLSNAYVPMSRMVDVFPMLRSLPEGFPGTGFKEAARKSRLVNRTVTDAPYSLVQRQMVAGTNRPSYVSSLIQKFSHGAGTGDAKLSRDDEDAIKETAAIMYGGGADTTVSTLNSFVLAMTLFPEVQQKAQREIDDVVGTTGRLPGYADREQLPYVNALVKESLRWFPVVPTGTTHMTEEEIVYEGFRIPKGAYLLPAIWWFLHDPQTYPAPMSFDPERFLEPRNEPNPTGDSFGYGRRICPGRYLAIESLFITISRILATFDIGRAVDAEGKELEVKIEATAGIITHVAPFPYTIKPRSAEHADLIRSVETEHPWEASDAVLLNRDAIADLMM